MATQLDILALEPFYGGERRAMLDSVLQCSRHRWTLLKLPPRRIERRLAAAANWFAEQISRHWSGRLDVLFASEAINLPELYRLAPRLTEYPSIVYFHDNQLSAPPSPRGGPVDVINVFTAAAASEVWFNSLSHLRRFLALATKLVERHPELSTRNPMPRIAANAQVMPPPMDMAVVARVKENHPDRPQRDPRAIFVETRSADIQLLNDALSELELRGEQFRLVTVGPVDHLGPRWQRRTVKEDDEVGQILGMLECGLVASVKRAAAFDYLVTRAILAGCRPVLPDVGVYTELLPESLHAMCLYPLKDEPLADLLMFAMEAADSWHPPDLRTTIERYEAINACQLFDDRIEQLAVTAEIGNEMG
jgi:hypothetical protein